MYWDALNHLSKSSQVCITRDSWPSLTYDDPSYDFHTQAWYLGAKQHQTTYFTEPYYDDGGADATMVSVVVANRIGDRFIGATGTDISLSRVTNLVGALHFASNGGDSNKSFAFLLPARAIWSAIPTRMPWWAKDAPDSPFPPWPVDASPALPPPAANLSP